MEQVEYAKMIAEEMQVDGFDVTYLDLLDYMAIVGVMFTTDWDGDASEAYTDEVASK